MKNRLSPLKGIIPPLVTPLADPSTLDAEGLERLIEHVLAGGVHGIFLLGTTGEGPSLPEHIKRELVTAACRIVGHRVPVLVGITDTAFAGSADLAAFAADAGADAVVLAPPFYFPAGQPELLEYLEALTPQLALPLFLYNMPAMTKINIEVDTLRRAAELDGVCGFKDSGGDMVRFHEYLDAMSDRPDFSILMGPEELLGEAVLFGAHGGVSGGANITPKLFVDLYEAATVGDLPLVRELQKKIFLHRRLYGCGHYPSGMIKGVKSALSLLGICSDCMARPFRAFQAPEREKIAELLDELGLMPPEAVLY